MAILSITGIDGSRVSTVEIRINDSGEELEGKFRFWTIFGGYRIAEYRYIHNHSISP